MDEKILEEETSELETVEEVEEETSEQETSEEVEEETLEQETIEEVEEETSEQETRDENVTSTSQNTVEISQDFYDVLFSIDTGIEFLNNLTLTLTFVIVLHIIIGGLKALFNKSIL